MRLTKIAYVAVAAAALALLPAGTAGAGSNHSISASPTTLRPGETTTVTGTSDCASSAYAVTLNYTMNDGSPQFLTLNGTTDADGEYTLPFDIPETAKANEPASLSSNIASCNGGGAAPSNSVTITIVPYDGTLAVTPTEGAPGTAVEISGTLCYGGRIRITFSDGTTTHDVPGAFINADHTFTASWEIPEAEPGAWSFDAECPGSVFPAVAFTVTAAEVDEGEGGGGAGGGGNENEAPPATPMPGTPNFTG